jgi:hypothetical protein
MFWIYRMALYGVNWADVCSVNRREQFCCDFGFPIAHKHVADFCADKKLGGL